MNFVRVSLYWIDLNKDNAKVHDHFLRCKLILRTLLVILFYFKEKNDGHKKANDSIYVFFIALKSHG